MSSPPHLAFKFSQSQQIWIQDYLILSTPETFSMSACEQKSNLEESQDTRRIICVGSTECVFSIRAEQTCKM